MQKMLQNQNRAGVQAHLAETWYSEIPAELGWALRRSVKLTEGPQFTARNEGRKLCFRGLYKSLLNLPQILSLGSIIPGVNALEALELESGWGNGLPSASGLIHYGFLVLVGATFGVVEASAGPGTVSGTTLDLDG